MFEIFSDSINEDGEVDNIKSSDVKLRRITSADLKIIYPRLKEVYSKTKMSNSRIAKLLYNTTWNESVVAEVDGNIAGFYFIARQNIPFYKPKKLRKLNKTFDWNDYDILVNGEGVEGIALGVFPEYKDLGIGKKLIEYPKTLFADYVWGYQIKSLDNIKDWLKRRKLYADVGYYITYQIFDDKMNEGIIDEKHIGQIHQPTGHSCGPTCMAMVKQWLTGDIVSIPDLCITCGTDWTVGTPPDRMETGLKHLNINYIKHDGFGNKDPFESMDEILNKGNILIIRTIIGGPHWIIVAGKEGNDYSINDPWQGELTLRKKRLDRYWSVRNYFCFEIIKH